VRQPPREAIVPTGWIARLLAVETGRPVAAAAATKLPFIRGSAQMRPGGAVYRACSASEDLIG